MTGPRRAYFVIGSNHEPERHLPAAIPLLAEYGRIVAVSAAYESPAWEGADEPHYLNAAVVLETSLMASAIFEEAVPAIERRLGRDRTSETNRHPIDVDLVLLDDVILDLGHHRLPEPDVLERPYLAIPLARVAPSLVFPGDGRTLREIADSFDDPRIRRRDDVVLTG